MYCSGCGLALPNEALSCPDCGKRCIQDEPVSNPVPEVTLQAAEGRSIDGRRSLESDSPTKPESRAPSTVEERSRLQRANAGSITLGAVALICLVLGAVQGFIPIFLIEGAVFGGLAWLCAAKWPLSQSLHAVVLVASLLLAGLVGVTLDQDTFGPRYRYLSQGSAELRVDEKAGRTDRLGSRGWYPVAYDKPPQDIATLGGNILEGIWDVQLTEGTWGHYGDQEVCFTIKNSSNYVLQSVSITVTTQQKDDPKKEPTSSETVILESKFGGLIPKGGSDLICGTVAHVFAPGESWSYSQHEVLGWK